MEEIVNIHVLEKILDECLPAVNRKEIEPYGKLMRDLKRFKIFFAEELRWLLEKHKVTILQADKKRVAEIEKEILTNGNTLFETNRKRLLEGVFYGHVSLAREALEQEFGEDWQRYQYSMEG